MKFTLLEKYSFLTIEGTNAVFTQANKVYETNDKKEIEILQSKEYLKSEGLALPKPKKAEQTTLEGQ